MTCEKQLRAITMTTFVLILAGSLDRPAQAQTDSPAPPSSPTANAWGFDPERHLGIDQIKRGMRGYGLTVFHGTKIERFDVEVISVMRNFEPKRDAFLVRCHDERFDIAKGVQGVSGSPVYFDGKIAGAMSFGWSFGEEPLYGVTPIREMLQVGKMGRRGATDSLTPSDAAAIFTLDLYRDLLRDTLLDSDHLNRLAQSAGLAGPTASSRNGFSRLPMQLVLTGSNDHAIDALRQCIPNLTFCQGLPVSGAAAANATTEDVSLQPGACLTVPLILGDMNGAILGTVTEVLGNEVYAFGHSWNGEGATDWPMATGFIHTFVNSKYMSFKLGDPLKIIGTLRADEATAVYGQIGPIPEMVPVDILVDWASGQLAQTEKFHMDIARNQQADPILATFATVNALLARGGLPTKHTIRYQITLNLDGIEPISYNNVSSASGISHVIEDMLAPLAMLLNNPWQRTYLKAVQVDFHVQADDHFAVVRSVQLPRRQYQPGQTINAFVQLQPLRGRLNTVPISMNLPDDLPDGSYEVVVGSEKFHRQQLQSAQPHRYVALDLNSLRDALIERLTIPRDRLFLSLIQPRGGVAIEGRPLPDLPNSKTMILTDPSRRMNMTPYRRINYTSVQTPDVIQGDASFEIEVRRN